ncbi:Outer membrane protein TolC [Hyunsoonleella jejuensis]|uniref:Outer membrane protein TolC n=1 Tax=Hyunsoonleella jejuensis TaxID=419940 RepID=A0A1H9A230_9FLAO|nr:TolC family protein [Hyunsoonleella jejuensis]SEP70704.1 Outer membrane protein TolC [Hyunsoonleella jejuensis]
MKKKLIIYFGLLFTISISSQDNNLSFSLEEAIDFALENNRTATNAQKDIEAAKKQKWETIASGLPQINGSIDYQNFLKQQVQVIPASAFGGPEGEVNAVEFGLDQNVNASATLSQLIFDGSYLVGLQSAKVFLEISENAKIKTDLEIRKQVINSYGNILLAEESVKILEKNKATLQKNLDEITKIYENGLEEEESVEQLKITLSGVESSLNNTKRLEKLAYQMLNMTLGIDINSTTTLTDNLELLTAKNIDLTLVSETLEADNTIDYLIAENDKTSKELLVKLEQSKALPTISTFLTGGFTSFSDDFDFFKSEQKYYGFGLLGVSIQIPIFGSGQKSASIQRAKINLEKSKDDLSETEQRIKLQIESAKSDYQFAIEDYNNKKENLNLAERIESKNETKFFEGIASSFDLRQAQIQLFSAQQEYLQAMLDVINRKAELETVSNKINN